MSVIRLKLLAGLKVQLFMMSPKSLLIIQNRHAFDLNIPGKKERRLKSNVWHWFQISSTLKSLTTWKLAVGKPN
jgi:hypothetical protein